MGGMESDSVGDGDDWLVKYNGLVGREYVFRMF